MNKIPAYPGTIVYLVTLGIVRAKWIAATNIQLGRGGAGFWFAWLLMPFANYGLTARLNEALAASGSTHRESPFWCFFWSGFPFWGSKKRISRAVTRLNDVQGARESVAA